MQTIFEKVKERKVLIAAHRGVNGGNIPCNSLEAYQIALNHGADIIELDITVSKDRKLYLLHPGMEWVHLGKSIDLSKMDSSAIKGLMLANQDICQTQYPLYTFDDALELLKNKCFINVDKFWSDPEEISKTIRKHNMTEQCIVKSYANADTPALLKAYAHDMQYMTMARKVQDIPDALFDPTLNFIGVEALFSSDDDEIASPEFIEKMHKMGKLMWGNAICYNYRDIIAGDHTDDKSLLIDPDYAWGWLAKRGFDIIQTDWTLPCSQYLISKYLRR